MLFARFVGPKTILLAEVIPEEREHPIGSISHKAMEENFEILSKETDQDGDPFQIVRIPLPPIILEKASPKDPMWQFLESIEFEDGTTLGKDPVDFVVAASYCNFLITNHVVLIPRYFKEGRSKSFQTTDEVAMGVIQKAFPERKVVAIDVENVNIGGGGMHCISQQEYL